MFCRTAALNFDVRKFFNKWLGDVRLEQREDGAVYGIVPESYKTPGKHSRISAGWGDCATIIPWQLYQIYGDKAVLEENFSLMCGWVEYLHGAGEDPDLWLGGFHYGDWLAMDAGEDELEGATSYDLIASAYYVYSLSLVVKAGEVIGRDVERYRELYNRAWTRFREVFMEDGLPKKKVCLTEFAQGLGTDVIKEGITQTAIVLILHFGLCLPEEREGLVKKLCELIEDYDGRMTTGFIGAPYILHALSDNGAVDMAYKLLFCEKVPSWLYSVNHGATTMWEHWNSLKEDGSFWSDKMNSFNHYAYGSVWDWIYANAAGISTLEDAVAFKRIKLAPKPTKELGFVRCSLDTVAGKVESNWYYKGDKVYFEFGVPEGSVAEITLPNGKYYEAGAGVHHFVV
jgi:alpha-L-rhamnosidase